MSHFTKQYTASEIDTIASNAMQIAGFTPVRTTKIDANLQKHIFAQPDLEFDISDPDEIPFTKSKIFTIYSKKYRSNIFAAPTDLSERKIALFNVAEDTDQDPKTGQEFFTSLEAALNVFVNDDGDCDELLIPIYRKRSKSGEMWNLLHITKKKNDMSDSNYYGCTLYDPRNTPDTTKEEYGETYIRQKCKNILGNKNSNNVIYKVTYLNQINGVKPQAPIVDLSGMNTIENLFHLIDGKALLSTQNNEKNTSAMMLNHQKICDKPESVNTLLETSKFKIEDGNKTNSVDSAKSADDSVNIHQAEITSITQQLSSATNCEGSSSNVNSEEEKQEIAAPPPSSPATRQNMSPPVDQNANSVQNREQIAEQPPIDEAFKNIKEIQKRIMDTKNWSTNFGGNKVYYYNTDTNNNIDPNSETFADVPDGVKAILDAIKAVQICLKDSALTPAHKNELCAATMKYIQYIAEERLKKPRFSCWFFKVRSDTTTSFYTDMSKNYNKNHEVSEFAKSKLKFDAEFVKSCNGDHQARAAIDLNP